MDKKEFRPLPEEFNLGYKPPVKEEEEEKKKKKRKLRKVLVLATAVLIILPLTLRTGLFSDPSSAGNAASNATADPSANNMTGEPDPENAVRLNEGTYYSGETYAHFDNAKGWFFNGEYFIPLEYDAETLEYRAAGAYPESLGLSLDSTAYYVTAKGEIGIEGDNLLIYDPFTQKTAEFRPSSASFDTTYIDRANSLSFEIGMPFGSWTGTLEPSADHPMAYLKSVLLSPDGTLTVTAGDTETSNTRVYNGSWTLKDGILQTSFDLPLEYEIKAGESTIRYTFKQQPEGILLYSEKGCYLYLNIFASQVFVRN